MDKQEQEQTTMLVYHPQHQRWEGHLEDRRRMWMSDDTFQNYVNVYLEGNFTTNPTEQQHTNAVLYCRRLSYWTYARYDCSIHFEQAL